jgi:PAS domain S-box-containing protein
MIEDIIKCKQAEAAQQISEERFRALVENSRVGIIMVNDAYRITYINDELCRIFGYAREELLSNDFRVFLDEESKHLIAERNLRRQKGEDITSRYEVNIIREDGEKRLVEINSTVIKDSGGKGETVGQVIDVTERKLAEEALRESEERYRTLVENIRLGISLIDTDHNIITTNAAESKKFKKSVNELIGKKCFREFEQRDAVCPHCPGVKAMVTGQPTEVEVEVVRDDQHRFLVRLQAFPIFGQDGTVTGFIEVAENITKRKQAEEQLRGQALIFENIHDGIITTNLKGNIINWNPAAERMFGYYKYEVFRKTIGVLATKIIKGSLRSGRWTGEMDFIRKDGTDGVCEITVIPLRDEDGNITAVFGVCRDITERKQAEEKLQRSYDQLRETLIATVNTLASTIETRDPHTAGHQRRVTLLSCAIAEEMGLAEDQFDGLRMAGLIHDLGKINIPAEILSKPGRINEIEFSIIRYHPQIGHDILKTIELPWPVAQIVLQHHERMDGSGYPQGLKGDEIMLEARILMVADVVEAMASHRPYRPSLGIKLALEEISKHRGILYDQEVVDVCVKLFTKKKFGFE